MLKLSSSWEQKAAQSSAKKTSILLALILLIRALNYFKGVFREVTLEVAEMVTNIHLAWHYFKSD